jgi:hypothetical protein
MNMCWYLQEEDKNALLLLKAAQNGNAEQVNILCVSMMHVLSYQYHDKTAWSLMMFFM